MDEVAASHAVHFYERDVDLAERVVAFIGEALLAGEAAVIVASEAHREEFVRRLRAMNIDVEAERAAGKLAVFDAAGTLAQLMVDGVPNPQLFRLIVGGVIGAACSRGPRQMPVRAYGEMVDILWRAGKREAAIALEELWNDLAKDYRFDLLCGYGIDAFSEASAGGALPAVCDRHTRVSVDAAPPRRVPPWTRTFRCGCSPPRSPIASRSR